MLRVSLEKRRVILIITTFLDRRLPALAVVHGFEDKFCNGLRAVGSHLARDLPKELFWIELPLGFFQDNVGTELRAFGHLDILAFIHELSEA